MGRGRAVQRRGTSGLCLQVQCGETGRKVRAGKRVCNATATSRPGARYGVLRRPHALHHHHTTTSMPHVRIGFPRARPPFSDNRSGGCPLPGRRMWRSVCSRRGPAPADSRSALARASRQQAKQLPLPPLSSLQALNSDSMCALCLCCCGLF